MAKQLHIALCLVMAFLLQFGGTGIRKQKPDDIWDYNSKITETKGAFTYNAYTSQDGKEAWIYEININTDKKYDILTIPGQLKGKSVTCIGFKRDEDLYKNLFGSYVDPYHDGDGSSEMVNGINKVKIPDSVEIIHSAAFSGMDGLKEITIPKKVKELKDYVFYGCTHLRTARLPDGMGKIDVTALRGCPELSKIKVSSKNKIFMVKGKCLLAKKDQALVYVMPCNKKLDIPEGTKIIKQLSFINSSPDVASIPASVTNIEGFAFDTISINEGCRIKNIILSKKNKTFARDGQCIYNKKEKSLSIAILNNKGILKVSDKIENLTNTYSIVNYTSDGKYFKKVIFPKTLKTVTVPAFSLISDAKKVYFTGKKPPEVRNIRKNYASLPVFTDIYVPESSAEIYKKWYEKYDCYTYVDHWYTYNP